jgi:hypothetical protein
MNMGVLGIMAAMNMHWGGALEYKKGDSQTAVELVKEEDW